MLKFRGWCRDIELRTKFIQTISNTRTDINIKKDLLSKLISENTENIERVISVEKFQYTKEITVSPMLYTQLPQRT